MQPSTVYCDSCGAANRPQARFCIACGQAMSASSLPPTVHAGPVTSAITPTVLAGPSSSSSAPSELLASHTLLKGRYRILSRLGQGGMGAVYKAADTLLSDRLVAVKEMSQKGLDPQETAEAAQAFKREAHMLARLFQRNLPRIYDHFEESGHCYLVMDFIAGESLDEYLNKTGGKLPVEEVLDIGIHLATVLDYLHQQQPPIIFRDLKPANVMRTTEGDLFLIDFGIARHFKPGQTKDTAAYGSAGYAAPEQYGKAQTTPRSDMYSLGAMLHYLLTGLNPSLSPFRFSPMSSAVIPAELGSLIAQMVEMDMEKRPASMSEVKQELYDIVAQLNENQNAPTRYVGGSSLPPTQLAVRPSSETVLRTEVVTVPPSQPSAFDPNATWGKLIFSNGKEAQLADELVLVGRVDHVLGNTPDVDLSDLPGADTTARRHAMIEHVGSAYTVTDLNSLFYTRLNGNRLEPDKATHLNNGDILHFGKVMCTFKKA